MAPDNVAEGAVVSGLHIIGVRNLEELITILSEDEETRRELLRPLSYRQYRMIEQSFSVWANEEQYVLSSIWDFLYDEGRIRNKKVMSVAEVDGCALVLEQVYVCLAGRHGGKKEE